MVVEIFILFLIGIGTLCIAIGFYKSKILLLIGHLVIGSHLVLFFLNKYHHWELAVGIILFILAGFVYKKDAEPWRTYLWIAMAAPLGAIYYLYAFTFILYNLFANHGWIDQLWR